MKILSVDWDYFYPDSSPYDWGARESPFFITELWKLRVADVNLLTQVPALKEYVPKVPRGFWKKIVSNKPDLYVDDSHKDIFPLLEKGSIVTNLDAHHDFGYEQLAELSCDNWAKIALDKGILKEYHLVYPAWRRAEDESENLKAGVASISYELPAKQDYDLIFVCRSGAWTPPWHDLTFSNFVGKAPRRYFLQAIDLRVFDLDKAIADEKIMFERIMGGGKCNALNVSQL